MNNNSLNETSTKEKLISVTQYAETGNLSVLSDFLVAITVHYLIWHVLTPYFLLIYKVT